MKIFVKYTGLIYIKYFFIIFIALELFYVGIDLLVNLDKMPSSVNLKLIYCALTFVIAIEYTLPLSLVLGLIITATNLIRSNELVSFYALGIKKNSLIMPMFFIALFFAVAQVCVYMTPFAYAKEQQDFVKDAQKPADSNSAVFLRFENKFIYINSLYFNKNIAKGVKIFEITNDKIQRQIIGDEAKFNGDNWIISNANIVQISPNLELNQKAIQSQKVQNLEVLEGFSPKTIQKIYQSDTSYSIFDAIKSIELLQDEAININKIKSALYKMVFFPLFAPFMVMIIYYYLPITARFASLALFSFMCILVSLGLWGVLFVFVRFSQNGVVIPELGIILPIVILAGFAGFKFYKNA